METALEALGNAPFPTLHSPLYLQKFLDTTGVGLYFSMSCTDVESCACSSIG